ncbi:MAG: orotate phosphoribosyltransferase [Cyclobacteriaceae bacterium]
MGYKILNQEVSKKVAAYLLEIDAIKINTAKPYTWTSGIKSPIYCDNRQTLSYPEIRNYIKQSLAEAVRTSFADVDVIAGVATAGIPQGALVADTLQLPFNYVRASAKKHGMGNQVEGKIIAGNKAVLVEDLVSTGGSSLAAAQSLHDAGYIIRGIVSIFTYGFPTADEEFEKVNVPLISLSHFPAMLEQALAMGKIDEEQMKMLKSWRVDPKNWKGK